MINYISTRSGGDPQTFEQVLLSGLAPDGGLYVPEKWPQIDWLTLRNKPYTDIAFAVMYPFAEGSISADEFKSIIKETYAPDVFRHKDVVPFKKLKDNLYALELFHGPTIAFKDVALQLLGRIFDHILTKRDETVTIVGATSGDTGSAAIEGCRHSKRVNIFILHPHGRVSEVQRRQMTTVNADNVHNIALEGTFDDCQNMVKAMFNDKKFRADMRLSAVNSINWARIMAQIVYYFTSALALNVPDEEISFVVPTGNFGNVFAAYCARKMGLPIKTLAISTNKNDILTRFFETGQMKMNGVQGTISPSMDIQISSNFERYLFDLFDRDPHKVTTAMNQFKAVGHFELDENLMAKARGEFTAFRADDAQTKATIKSIYDETGYILDPHTAVGMTGALEMAVTNKNENIISLACAHPAKFPDAVEDAIATRPPLPSHLSDLLDRTEHMTRIDNDIENVQQYIKDNRE